MPSFSAQQKAFIGTYAKATGLHPGVVAAQVAAEEPVGARAAWHGTQNWLNIGITDSGPMGAGNPAWHDPVAAARLSAQWVKGQTAIPGFGRASSGIQAIARTAGRSPQAQIAALQHSGWASSGYPSLGSLFQAYGATNPAAPSGARGLPAAPGAAPAPTVPVTTQQFDQAAFDKAQRAAVAGQFLAQSAKGVSMWQTGPKTTVPGGASLFGPGMLTTTEPNRADFTTTKTTQVAQTNLQRLAGGTPLNTHPALSAGGDFATPAPQKVVDMQNFAKTLIGAPYSQANHAASFTQGANLIKKYGTDCSGLVSLLLGRAGILSSPQTTETIAGQPGIVPGPGAHVTIWNRAGAGANSHMIVQIGKDWFESGGRIGGGVVHMSNVQAQQELSGGGFRPLHPRNF